MGSFNKLKKLLEDKERFLLVCHIEPDGDAVGSMLALGESLRDRGKSVRTVCLDLVPNILSYLNGSESIQKTTEFGSYDAIILLDNGDARRTGFAQELSQARKIGIPIVNIDHHPKNDLWKIVDINYANEKVSSASELVYNILVGLNYDITPSIATALLTGIFYDTGGFRHSNTSEIVLGIAADLLRRGAKLKRISENIANSKPINVFKLWGIALNRLKINQRYGITVSVLSLVDLERCGAAEEDVSGLVNLLSGAPESKAALLLYETKDGKIKGSLRTDRDDMDLALLAQVLGGGGHKKASGFTILGRLEIDEDRWKIV